MSSRTTQSPTFPRKPASPRSPGRISKGSSTDSVVYYAHPLVRMYLGSSISDFPIQCRNATSSDNPQSPPIRVGSIAGGGIAPPRSIQSIQRMALALARWRTATTRPCCMIPPGHRPVLFRFKYRDPIPVALRISAYRGQIRTLTTVRGLGYAGPDPIYKASLGMRP
jgi:hypothetical protein